MPNTRDVVTAERTVRAAPQTVFDLLADPRRHADIDGSGTVRGPRGESARLQLGSKFGMSMRMGLPYRTENEVVEFDEPRCIAWQTKGAGLIGFVGGRIWRYQLEPVEGGTLVKESWDITHESPLTKPVVRMATATTAKNMSASLDRIEKLVTA